jgi:hypothetical protein
MIIDFLYIFFGLVGFVCLAHYFLAYVRRRSSRPITPCPDLLSIPVGMYWDETLGELGYLAAEVSEGSSYSPDFSDSSSFSDSGGSSD